MRKHTARGMGSMGQVLLTAAILVAPTGCFELDMFGPNDCLFYCYTEGGVTFGMSPGPTNILRGDTIGFYTWSCESGGFFCGTTGNVLSQWTIGGNAATAVLSNGTTTRTVPSAMQIVVRGTAAGHSDITAVALGDSANTRSVRLHVADSSAIDSILVSSEPPDIGHQWDRKLGRLWSMNATLRDSAGRVYTGRPTAWSIGDTSIVELDGPARYEFGQVRQVVRSKKVGTTDIVVKFLDVSTSVRITVTP